MKRILILLTALLMVLTVFLASCEKVGTSLSEAESSKSAESSEAESVSKEESKKEESKEESHDA